MKVFFYTLCCAAEDPETQIRGVVMLCYHMGPFGHNPEPDIFREAAPSPEWLPFRFSCTHVITDRRFNSLLLRIILSLTTREFRARYRLHEGKLTGLVLWCLQTESLTGLPFILSARHHEGRAVPPSYFWHSHSSCSSARRG